MNTAQTAYSYIRFSTPEQRLGRSYDRQKEMAEKYCRERGLLLDKTMTLDDTGVSAFRGTHRRTGALSRFLGAVKDGRIKTGSILLLENLDRLSREEIDDAQETLKQILRAGIDVVTLTDGEIYTKASLNNPYALIKIILIAGRAHEESETKSKRVADAWAKKHEAQKKNGVFLTHLMPAWLSFDEKKKEFHPIPERVRVINDILQLARDGAGSTKIVKHLNKHHIASFTGGTWDRGSVRRLLHSRALIGEFQARHVDENGHRVPHGDPITNYYPTVVDPGLFHYIQSKRGSPLKGPQNLNRVNNLFSGLLTCGYCGASMFYIDKGKNHRYVVCSTAKKGAGCQYVSLQYDEFERSFLETCRKEIDIPSIFNDKKSRELAQTISDLQKTVQGTEARIADNRARTQRLMTQFADTQNKELRHNYEALLGAIATETEALTKALADRKSELLRLRSVKDSLHDNLKAVAEYGRDKKLKSDPELRARIRNSIRDIVDWIEIYPGGSKKIPEGVLNFVKGNVQDKKLLNIYWKVNTETNPARPHYSIRFKNGAWKMTFLNLNRTYFCRGIAHFSG
jgi:DNA invertase Pin-like site-specific DNA recombinase